MKFFSPVAIPEPSRRVSLSDGIMMLGSCFADSVGQKMAAGGFRVCINPFGTLYNPASILGAIKRLDSDSLFLPSDCVDMGAGAGRTCSFEHHTSFARTTAEEFLQNANDNLLQAREFWNSCNIVVISLGTSFAWYHSGRVVANCLKRPSGEFTRRMLSSEESAAILGEAVSSHPEKHFILTVSPIRHMGDGAHANSLSKASLLLAADSVKAADYFPAFEILLDELRDYRFYAEDLVHPSPVAVSFIWDRFLESFVCPGDLDAIRSNERASRQSSHRPLLVR